MRPQSVTLSAAGFSPWFNINRMPQGNFGVAFAGEISSGASLTWGVQHTYDPLYEPTKEWSASRTTTTGTITLVGHKLAVGDWVQMDAAAPFNQGYSVASVVDANNITVTVANSGVTSVAKGASNLWTARVVDHTVTGKTTSFEGSYSVPPTAIRLNISAYTSGSVSLNIIQVG